jgi:hypothetical protein
MQKCKKCKKKVNVKILQTFVKKNTEKSKKSANIFKKKCKIRKKYKNAKNTNKK